MVRKEPDERELKERKEEEKRYDGATVSIPILSHLILQLRRSAVRMTCLSAKLSYVDALDIIFSHPGLWDPAYPAARCKEPYARRGVLQVSPYGGDRYIVPQSLSGYGSRLCAAKSCGCMLCECLLSNWVGKKHDLPLGVGPMQVARQLEMMRRLYGYFPRKCRAVLTMRSFWNGWGVLEAGFFYIFNKLTRPSCDKKGDRILRYSKNMAKAPTAMNCSALIEVDGDENSYSKVYPHSSSSSC